MINVQTKIDSNIWQNSQPRIYVIGDSHTLAFKGVPPFIVHHIGPTTAHNLHRKGTTTASNEKLFDIINQIDRKRDLVMLVFGEIDCRIHIYNQYKKLGEVVSIPELIDRTVFSYGLVLKQLSTMGINMLVYGVPPAATQGNLYGYTHYAPPEVRSQINRLFNRHLQQYCIENGYKYIDIYPHVCDESGFIKPEFRADEVHLNNRASSIVLDILGIKHTDHATPHQKFSLYHSGDQEQTVKAWQAPYADLFKGCKNVLDVGCGPGLFLELLRERGIPCLGLDFDSAMVQHCQDKGLNAQIADARTLSGYQEAFDGIHLGHVIEHMDGPTMIGLIESCIAALTPGGLILIRTPNWQNETVRKGGFWLDHTHVRPYPLELLERIFLDLGLKILSKGYEAQGWNDIYIYGKKEDSTYDWERSSGQEQSAQRLPIRLPVSVVWEGTQFVHHSLALINREIAIRLAQNKHVELSVVPFGPNEFGAKADPRFKLIAQRENRELSHPAEFHVRHMWPPVFTPPKDGHWIVMQPWEFGSIPKAWIEAWRDKVDELWVYTNYVRDCYVQSGMPAERIQVIPCGVDINIFHPKATRIKLKTKKKFKFLFVGGTIGRKGIDLLLQTYIKTFTSSDDVSLVIKDMGGKSFYKGHTANDLIARCKAMPGAPEIEYIDRMLNNQELAGLYTACDCLVHPYRGEGFGLPIAEAMASGLPVIITGKGAAIDFCDEENAYLIPASIVQHSNKLIGDYETVDYPWWYEPDVEVLHQHMRHVFENRDEARAKGRAGFDRIRSQYTWGIMAKRVEDRFEVLRDTPIRRFAPLHEVAKTEVSEQGTDGTSAPEIEETVHGMLERAARCEEQNETEMALSLYEKVLMMSPSCVEALFSLGRLKLIGGDIESAVAHLRKTVDLVPDHTLAHNFLGLALQAIGDLESAVNHLELAVATGGATIPSMRSLADAYLAVERFEEAIALYKRLTETPEGQVSDVVGMAEAFKGLGQLSFAQECYEIALEIDPDLEAASIGLQILRQAS